MRLPGQIEAVFIVATLAASIPAQTPTPAAKPTDPLHAWGGLRAASDLEAWTQWHISEENRLVAALLAAKGMRTPDNTLELYDQAQFHLTIAGNEVGALFQVHPQSDIRDKAQTLSQLISAQTVVLSLNRDVYQALSAIDLTNADAATKHYVDRILLEYRLGGVDKDAATRETVRKLADQIGDRFYASFTHLTGYSSNYYTYLLDKVIAADFFAQFDKKEILDGPAAPRYRKTVLEPGSSKRAADLVHDFLGRPQTIDALKKWMDQEFETDPIQGRKNDR